MTPVLHLETRRGQVIELTLPPPAESKGFYVLSMGYSGNAAFLDLLERLTAAAERPFWRVDQALAAQGATFSDLTEAARKAVVRLDGYGLGNFFDLEPAHCDEIGSTRQALLFLRDPGDMVRLMYERGAWRQTPGSSVDPGAAPGPPAFAEFVGSPRVASVLARYRRFAAFRHGNPNVLTIRYEQALAGWQGIAADLVAFLGLPLDPAWAMRIAAQSSPVGDRLASPPHAGSPRRPDAMAGALSQADYDLLAKDVVPAGARFGYSSAAPAAQEPGVPPSPSADSAPRDGDARLLSLSAIFESDPQLFVRLRPNTSAVLHVLGRDVVMDVDAAGCRPVPGQADTAETTLALYGCSFTYGIAVQAAETFPTKLQAMLPTWRIENHGISGHGTTQNLLLLERNTRWNRPEHVGFCWMHLHRIRNVVDIEWVQRLNKTNPASYAANPRQMPRSALDQHGMLTLQSIRVPRHDLSDLDLTDFRTDQFYQDMVNFRLFQRAAGLVRGYGGKFFVVNLLGNISDAMAGWMAAAQIPILDINLQGNEWTCLPDDGHPNAQAHQVYAERIFAFLTSDAASPGPSDTGAAWPIGPLA